MESPYDLYRKMNSQYFSDTVVSYKVELTEELFRYEMDKLSDNMKQDLFENFGGTEGPGPVVPSLSNFVESAHARQAKNELSPVLA